MARRGGGEKCSNDANRRRVQSGEYRSSHREITESTTTRPFLAPMMQDGATGTGQSAVVTRRQ